MTKELELVRKFQVAFGQPVATYPQTISIEDMHRRFHLMKEELEEYADLSSQPADIEGQAEILTDIADALGDLLYTVYGTIIEHGLTHIMPAIFEKIHRSNMSKLDDDGNPVYKITADGVKKVAKSDNFYPPEPKIKSLILSEIMFAKENSVLLTAENITETAEEMLRGKK
jgi:predicted HAD superfamily Cof-like phosphohydrolase